jgi:hypothetical protein
MKKISQKDIDWLMQLDGRNPQKVQRSSPKKRNLLLRTVFWVMLVAGLGILPFFLLIRTSLFLNLSYNWNGWLALGAGIGATILLLLLYILLLFRRTSSKKTLLKFSLAGTSILVLSFCVYGMMYLSTVNAKSEEIREVYRSMHPVLRVAVATTTLADGDLVITDIRRSPEDYTSMGLPLNERSLHFTQPTGYVHAIDLRTIGRNEFRNVILQKAFDFMGFQTIRHIGSADHLHIALPVSS